MIAQHQKESKFPLNYYVTLVKTYLETRLEK